MEQAENKNDKPNKEAKLDTENIARNEKTLKTMPLMQEMSCKKEQAIRNYQKRNTITQRRINDVKWDEMTSETYLGLIMDKENNTTRLMFMNVGGLPTSN